MSQPLIQILYEQYRSNDNLWHTRECYPWEYEVKAQECYGKATPYDWYGCPRLESECKWFLQQAKILQNRAGYIRQQWAAQQATQLVTQAVTQQATPPTPEQQEQEQEQKQCNVEKIAENTAENIAEKPTASSNSTVNKSLLPIILHQAVKQFDGELASHDSFRLRFLTEHYHYALLASRPGYIEYAKEMEATGQG